MGGLIMSESARPPKPPGKSSSRPAAPRSAVPQLPPQVVKKKKPVKRESSGRKRNSEPADPPSEFIVPIILIVVGLVANTVTTLMLRDQTFPLALWVGIRMVIVVLSALITYGALFIAAQVLDTDYGYISTGATKVAAIVLTQSWVGDLAEKIPVPFLPWLIAAATTYGMFMYFFDLELGEAIASVIVVRLVHFLVLVLAFIGIMGLIMGGQSVDLSAPAAVLAPGGADNDPELDAEDQEVPAGAKDMPANFNNPQNNLP
jgi:hypothetical protein